MGVLLLAVAVIVVASSSFVSSVPLLLLPLLLLPMVLSHQPLLLFLFGVAVLAHSSIGGVVETAAANRGTPCGLATKAAVETAWSKAMIPHDSSTLRWLGQRRRRRGGCCCFFIVAIALVVFGFDSVERKQTWMELQFACVSRPALTFDGSPAELT
jgi:hypothetical protein